MRASPRSGNPVDPIARFRRWMRDAERARAPLPEAMALATVDARGRPAARFVLLKQCDGRGFVFFTDSRSRKVRELRTRPRAALVFYWSGVRRQVRIEGIVERVSDAEADAYWATRPRESRIAASVSLQSAPLRSRSDLVKRWRELRARARGRDVPRPVWWTGYRLRPDAIEFWTHREHRLHDRVLFVRTRGGWTSTRLQP